MIDNDKLIQRLKEGMSNAQGGREFSLSAERVRQKRNEFIEKDLLTADIKHDGRAQRAQRKQVGLKPQRKPIIEPNEAFEQVVRAFERAKQADILETENWELKNKLAAEREVRTQLEKRVKGQDELARRIKVAQKAGATYGD